MPKKQKVVILGSTGSIGRACLEIIARNPDRYEVLALACGENTELLSKQIARFSPKYVFCNNPQAVNACNIHFANSLAELATLAEADSVLFATVGFTCADAVISAIKCKKRIMLANKETLVCAGDIIMPLAKQNKVDIIPVDSEHSAIWQLMQGDMNTELDGIVITASGGAFRDYTFEMLSCANAQQALKHPNWDMGNKITIDSSTLVNKGLEVIEAHHLFALEYKNIECIMHRQSIIHSMVRFRDGVTLAQMSYPTMEIPISLALSYPERISTTCKHIDFLSLKNLDFEAIDNKKFPCFDIIVECGKQGGILPAAANAANEILVDAFLHDRIPYLKIAETLQKVVCKTKNIKQASLRDIFECDSESRKITKSIINSCL